MIISTFNHFFKVFTTLNHSMDQRSMCVYACCDMHRDGALKARSYSRGSEVEHPLPILAEREKPDILFGLRSGTEQKHIKNRPKKTRHHAFTERLHTLLTLDPDPFQGHLYVQSQLINAEDCRECPIEALLSLYAL